MRPSINLKKSLEKLIDDYIEREYWGARDIAGYDRSDITEDDVEFDYEGEEENE